MRRTRVLFLCTGNSCRSQMAEGWARHLAGDRWEVRSAGTHPAGLNARAVRVMAEAGVDISWHHAKALDPELLQWADRIITLCDNARDRCPATPPHIQRLHWPVEDPVWAWGSEEEVLAVFRRVRDEIRKRIEALLEAEPRDPG